MDAPTSKSQSRAIKLAGLTAPASYQEAAALLEAKSLRTDGIPPRGTWRTAAKMSDAELMSAIRVTVDYDSFETIDR